MVGREKRRSNENIINKKYKIHTFTSIIFNKCKICNIINCIKLKPNYNLFSREYFKRKAYRTTKLKWENDISF